MCVCLYTCGQMCLQVCPCPCRSQRSIFGCLLKLLSILIFETGSLTEPGASMSDRLAGPKDPLVLVLGLQVHPLCLDFEIDTSISHVCIVSTLSCELFLQLLLIFFWGHRGWVDTSLIC